MTHTNLSTLIRNQYLHPAFSTRWVTVHTLPIHPKERATTWRKLNEMCRVPCYYRRRLEGKDEIREMSRTFSTPWRVRRNPRSSVIISFPYSSAFVRYSDGKRRIRRRWRRKRQNAKNVMDVFYALARFRVKERVTLSSVLSPRQFYSPSFHSVEC